MSETNNQADGQVVIELNLDSQGFEQELGRVVQSSVKTLEKLETSAKKAAQAVSAALVGSVGSASASVGKLATGTAFAREGWYLVGEQGPELVRLAGGEAVFNAARTADLLQSGAASPPEGGAGTVYHDNSQMVLNVNAADLGSVVEWWKNRRRTYRQGEVKV